MCPFSLNGRILSFLTVENMKLGPNVSPRFRLLHTASLHVTYSHLLQANPLLLLYVKCAPTWMESILHSPKHKVLSTITDQRERNTQRQTLPVWNEVPTIVKIHEIGLLCCHLLSLRHVLTYRWGKWLYIQYRCKYTDSTSSTLQ
jgi:hypothetical protein